MSSQIRTGHAPHAHGVCILVIRSPLIAECNHGISARQTCSKVAPFSAGSLQCRPISGPCERMPRVLGQSVRFQKGLICNRPRDDSCCQWPKLPPRCPASLWQVRRPSPQITLISEPIGESSWVPSRKSDHYHRTLAVGSILALRATTDGVMCSRPGEWRFA